MWQRLKALSITKKIVGGVVMGFIALLTIGALSPQPKVSPSTHLETDKTSQTSGHVQGESTTSSHASNPHITTKTVTEVAPIPYESVQQNDSTLDSGKTVVVTSGVKGEKTLTYRVTYSDGVETDRVKVSEAVTKQPITETIKVGTKVAAAAPPASSPADSGSNCNPNYAGACVPIASDVDCAGGGGNGPAYVQGPVRVIGTDVYGLDRDGNGIGCEN